MTQEREIEKLFKEWYLQKTKNKYIGIDEKRALERYGESGFRAGFLSCAKLQAEKKCGNCVSYIADENDPTCTDRRREYGNCFEDLCCKYWSKKGDV